MPKCSFADLVRVDVYSNSAGVQTVRWTCTGCGASQSWHPARYNTMAEAKADRWELDRAFRREHDRLYAEEVTLPLSPPQPPARNPDCVAALCDANVCLKRTRSSIPCYAHPQRLA